MYPQMSGELQTADQREEEQKARSRERSPSPPESSTLLQEPRTKERVLQERTLSRTAFFLKGKYDEEYHFFDWNSPICVLNKNGQSGAGTKCAFISSCQKHPRIEQGKLPSRSLFKCFHSPGENPARHFEPPEVTFAVFL